MTAPFRSHDTMTEKQRVHAAVEFGGPDRAPIQHFILPGAIRRHGEKLFRLVEEFRDDFGNQGVPSMEQALAMACEGGTKEFRDPWGSLCALADGHAGSQVIVPAIEDWEQFADYRFPPQPDDAHFEAVARRVREHPEQWVMECPGGFFQQIQHVRGNANVYLDLAEDREELHRFADIMNDRAVECAERYVAAGVDCLTFGDDWGSQDRLLISPDMWRAFFKPRYKRIFDVARAAGVHVWFHTDGWTEAIIEDLIEIGVTVLNPQHHLMGTARLGEWIGGRVCIRTDIDRQHTLAFGTPDDVRARVREAYDAFGVHNGGIIFHGEIGTEVPFENIRAMYEAFAEVGRPQAACA